MVQGAASVAVRGDAAAGDVVCGSGVDLGVPVTVLGRALSDLHAASSSMMPVILCEPAVGVLRRDVVVCGNQRLANVPGPMHERWCVFPSSAGQNSGPL